MPADAPIHPADCGWPADTALAFAAWVDEPEQAGLPAGYGLVSGQRAFVLVTLHRVRQQPMAGPAIDARGGCVRLADGRTTVGLVPDDAAAAEAPARAMTALRGGAGSRPAPHSVR